MGDILLSDRQTCIAFFGLLAYVVVAGAYAGYRILRGRK